MDPPKLYRSFLKHLRVLPDPHAWSVLQPRIAKAIRGARIEPESSADAVVKAERAAALAKKELKRLRMAVACHPHALARLLHDVYGQQGALRWELIRNIMATSTPPISPIGRPDLPAPLKPHRPDYSRQPPSKRARVGTTPTAERKDALKRWQAEWAGVKSPLILRDGPSTGWENKDIIENLRVLARLDTGPISLQSLSPRLQRIYPRRPYTLPEPPYPSPPPRATRQKPRTWSHHRDLTPRLLSRVYRRLWKSLKWSRQRNGSWVACTYEELQGEVEKPKLVLASETDRKWL